MNLFVRVGYTLKKMWAFRRQLHQVMVGRCGFIDHNICDIKWAKLKKLGYEVVVLDFDGVLACYGQIKIDRRLLGTFEHIIDLFSPQKVYILTNKPFQDRLDYLEKNYPEVSVISGVRKKPYPDGLIQVAQLSQVRLSKMLMVDDRLLTGVLAGLMQKVQIVYVTQAIKDFRRAMWHELFFQFLRISERLLVRMLRFF